MYMWEQTNEALVSRCCRVWVTTYHVIQSWLHKHQASVWLSVHESQSARSTMICCALHAQKCSCVEAERYVDSCADPAQMGYPLAPAAAVCRVRSPTLEKLTDWLCFGGVNLCQCTVSFWCCRWGYRQRSHGVMLIGCMQNYGKPPPFALQAGNTAFCFRVLSIDSLYRWR